jgi:hypothetical protein
VDDRDQLTINLSRLGGGKVVGRFAIAALVVSVTIRAAMLFAVAAGAVGGAISLSLSAFRP